MGSGEKGLLVYVPNKVAMQRKETSLGKRQEAVFSGMESLRSVLDTRFLH